MTAKDRLREFIKFKALNKHKFCVACGFSVGFVNSGAGVSSEKLSVVHDRYPELNMDWLVTGRGDMIRTDKSTLTEDIVSAVERHNRELMNLLQVKNRFIESLEKEISDLKLQQKEEL